MPDRSMPDPKPSGAFSAGCSCGAGCSSDLCALSALASTAAIVRLTHDYCWALDTRDWERLRLIFLPDVVAHLGAGGQRGVDEVIARTSSALSRLDVSQHTVSTHDVNITGDSATGRCYLHAQHVLRGTPGGDNFVIGGRYDDRYVRTSAGWRIAERRLTMIWFEGNPAVVQH
jgi:ketosteroid isomerase-like protein